jgi:hypothetical protein
LQAFLTKSNIGREKLEELLIENHQKGSFKLDLASLASIRLGFKNLLGTNTIAFLLRRAQLIPALAIALSLTHTFALVLVLALCSPSRSQSHSNSLCLSSISLFLPACPASLSRLLALKIIPIVKQVIS